MGRHACLGRDVLDQLGVNTPVVNIQKGRVDYILQCTRSMRYALKVSEVSRHAINNRLLAQQQALAWFGAPRPPELVYMDSYSELTDKLFVSRRDGWGFCAHFSDLNRTADFASKFDCKGLIGVNELGACYEQFFGFIRRAFGPIPIVFLHFPSKLEVRDLYRSRAAAITEAIAALAPMFRPFFDIHVPEEEVDWPEVRPPSLENFPYHYNSRTYVIFANTLAWIPGLNKVLLDHEPMASPEGTCKPA